MIVFTQLYTEQCTTPSLSHKVFETTHSKLWPQIPEAIVPILSIKQFDREGLYTELFYAYLVSHYSAIPTSCYIFALVNQT